jgi:putative ABC transport system ATP-binding protein
VPIIAMSDVTKVYDTSKVKVQALHPTNFIVEEGELVSIVGPSGSGKSTLMNLVGCLDRPTEGDYLLEGRPVSSLEPDELADIRNKKIGFVFQNFNLLHYATAAENVELPMIFAGESARRRKERVAKLLEEVGLSDRADHRPAELSGGQMQRVAIARSLANEPSILLADEPTGNLDTTSGEEIIQIFEKLHEKGHTILMVTHNPEISERTERTVSLRDGRIVEDYRRNGSV